ncbi:hypothetical protein [Caldilinea sp.]|jgi:hypothetical protein|uniref:hypothetical protein n=1 Tax=Caldilinea sp. TaxID=2293560 RepID=UPI0021DC7919|nr:hypothetical protein [Caldilinea sp.]GIV68598.1 MAG: hypothetical protein KatS3mg048_1460 [Caldilinea sp.]
MSTRKPTPDILDAVLNADAGAAEDEAVVALTASPAVSPPRAARRVRTKAQLPAAQDQTAAPPVPTVVKPLEWEYREVIVRDYRGWRVRFVDGREQPHWKNGPTLREYLEQVGKEGWELVHIGERHHNQKMIYLKRLKS